MSPPFVVIAMDQPLAVSSLFLYLQSSVGKTQYTQNMNSNCSSCNHTHNTTPILRKHTVYWASSMSEQAYKYTVIVEKLFSLSTMKWKASAFICIHGDECFWDTSGSEKQRSVWTAGHNRERCLFRFSWLGVVMVLGFTLVISCFMLKEFVLMWCALFCFLPFFPTLCDCRPVSPVPR